VTHQAVRPRVVLGPDVILAALFDAKARAILNEWRDGRIEPVLNRELLFIYLRLLRDVGINEKLLKHWTAWFTNPEKVLFLDAAPNKRNVLRTAKEVCADLAEKVRCETIGLKGNLAG